MFAAVVEDGAGLVGRNVDFPAAVAVVVEDGAGSFGG